MLSKKIFYYFTVPLFVILLGVFIYQPSLRAPFQFDDTFTIVDNFSIKNLNCIPCIWMFDPSRFLTHLSFAVNYHFHQLNVIGYHVVNFSLHLLISFIVYFFARFIVYQKLALNYSKANIETFSVMALCIFLCHPIQTQSATYISQRSTLLAALFYLLTVIFYVYCRFKNNYHYYILAIISAGIGVFAKPNFITLPFALIVCEIFFFDFLKNRPRKIITGVLPFFLVIIVVPVLLILWKYHTLSPHLFLNITHETEKIPRINYLCTQFNVLMTYIRLIFIPIRQNLDYDYPIAKSFFDFPTYLSFFALICILVFAIKAFKTHRLISFCIFWFFLTLSLESSIFPISDVIFEHRLYLPMVGVACCFPILFQKLFRERFHIGSFCLILIIFSFLSYQRNLLWSNRIALLQDVAKKSPHKARVHNNLAVFYDEKGDLEKAEMEYQKAISIDKQYAHPRNNLGNIYAIQGKTKEAIEQFEIAMAIDPHYEVSPYNLGNIYYQKQDFKKAEEYYRQALKIKPFFVSALVGLANVCLKKRDLIQAKFLLTEAIHLNPAYPYAYYGLGDIYLSLGDYSSAIKYYRKAIKIKPDMSSAYNNIGNILDMQGWYKAAVRHYSRAICLTPQFANAYLNLSNTLSKLDQKSRAIENLKIALKLYEEQKDFVMAQKVKEKLQELNK